MYDTDMNGIIEEEELVEGLGEAGKNITGISLHIPHIWRACLAS